MSESSSRIPPVLLTWLAAHTRFPAIRLPERAETLLCLAAAAAIDEEQSTGLNAGSGIQRREPAREAAQKAHAMRRSRVHFKCDNSAKV